MIKGFLIGRILTQTPAKSSHPVPHGVQRNAKDGKQVCTPQGKSDQTIRRQKKALRDLQAQGFKMLPDFFKKKAKEKNKQAMFEVMVARVKAC